MESLNRTLTVEEAARRLGTGVNYIYNLLREGKLRGRKTKPENRPAIWKIDESSVEARRRSVLR